MSTPLHRLCREVHTTQVEKKYQFGLLTNREKSRAEDRLEELKSLRKRLYKRYEIKQTNARAIRLNAALDEINKIKAKLDKHRSLVIAFNRVNSLDPENVSDHWEN